MGGECILLGKLRVLVWGRRFRGFPGHCSHGDELLSGRGVDPDRRVEVLLGRSHLDGDTNALHDLPGILAHHVHADDTVARRIHYQLHHAPLRAPGQCVLHRAELRLEYLNPAIFVHGLLLRVSHRCYRGLRENRRGDELVVRLGGLRVEQCIRNRHAFHEGDGGEINPVSHVAHGVNVGHVCALVFVHHDGASARQGNARIVQAKALDVWLPSRRVHDLVEPLDPVVPLDLDALPLAIAAGAIRRPRHQSFRDAARVHPDTLLLQLVVKEAANLSVETSEDHVPPKVEVDLGPEGVEDGRKLHRDVATPDDGDFLRHGGEV
mmetsp:Transcript_12478/g.31680  ORF Transcript_12478/g.31680 Transcript_12478/m.31680 type:complete len:322 (-) Transcript_12478:824-1789(-)